MSKDYYTTEELAEELDQPKDTIEECLRELEDEGIVANLGDDKWDILNMRKAGMFLAKHYPKIKANEMKERARNFFGGSK